MSEERLKELSKCELFLDNIVIKDKTARQILVSAYNKLERQQKEIEEKNIAVNKMSKDISRQLEEIEEKSTIIMAGAEKVKQLEKGNRSLMESRIKWKNRYYKEKAKNKECISKDKIREKIEKLKEIADEDNPDDYIKIDAYEELLEEK